MVQKLKHMYYFEPEVQIIKKGSPGEIWFLKQSFTDFLQKGILNKISQILQENNCVGDTF